MRAHMHIERHTCYFAKIWLYCFQGEYIVSFLPPSLFPSLPLSLSVSLSFFLSSRFNPKVGKIPWRREQQCTPVFLPENFQGQSSLVGYPQSMSQCIADPARHANCFAVHTACTVNWTRVDKAQAKRLEDSRIRRNCRRVYFLLNSAAAWQQPYITKDNTTSLLADRGCSSRHAIFSPLLADPTDKQWCSSNAASSSGGAHICIPYTTRDPVKTSWPACAEP